MLPLSRRVAVFLYCNILELNRATKEFFSASYIYVERNERHSVPHLHAYYAEHSIVVDFEGNVLEGSLPRKKQAMLIAWTMMHEDELRANYDLMLEGQLPFRIDPLR